MGAGAGAGTGTGTGASCSAAEVWSPQESLRVVRVVVEGPRLRFARLEGERLRDRRTEPRTLAPSKETFFDGAKP